MLKQIRKFGVVALLSLAISAASANGADENWETLNQQVIELYRAGEYDLAAITAKKAAPAAEKNAGPDHPDVAVSLDNLAFLHQARGRLAEAGPRYRRSLAIREKALGPDHPDVAASLDNLAEIHRARGQYAEAEKLYQRTLAILEKALDPAHPNVASCLENMAVLYRETSRPDKAEKFERQAAAIRAGHAIQADQFFNAISVGTDRGRRASPWPPRHGRTVSGRPTRPIHKPPVFPDRD